MPQETDVKIANIVFIEGGGSLCSNCGESLNQSLELWIEQGFEVIRKNMKEIQKSMASFSLFEKGLSQKIELPQQVGFPPGYYMCPKCGSKLYENIPAQGNGDFS